MVRTYVYVE